MKTLLRLTLAGLAGGLMWAGFPGGLTLGWVGVVAAVALLFGLLKGAGARNGALVGAAFSIAFFVPHISWARIAVGTAGPWLALAGVQVLFVTVWGLAAGAWGTRRWARRHPWTWAAMLVVSYVGVEQLRGVFPFGGFPWGFIAYPAVDSPLLAAAPLGGEVAVGALMATLAAALALALGPTSRMLTRVCAASLAALVVSGCALVPLRSHATGEELRIAAVQGNVDRPVKQTYGTGSVLANHARVSMETIDPSAVDLVLWGEHAADKDPHRDAEAGRILDDVSTKLGVPLVYGTVRNEGQVRFGEYRVAGTNAFYDKRRPVPFGEYVPHRDFFRKLSDEVDQIGRDMVAGEGDGVLRVEGTPARLGIAMCFEVAIEDLVGDTIAQGANLLIVPTNNALFGNSAESLQQLQMTRLRAATFGRYGVQVSTQGVSAIVTDTGQVIARTRLFQPAVLVRDVVLTDASTPAVRVIGPLRTLVIALTVAWGSLVLLLSPILSRVHRKEKRSS